jgi:polyhydroxyalkanoate synthase subunit PhaC
MNRFLHENLPTPDGQLISLSALPATEPRGAVLLLHGFGQNLMTWHAPQRSFAEHLCQAGWDVYVAELRGHGRSRKLCKRCARSLSDYFQHDLPTVMEALKGRCTERPLAVLGHSLGGLMAAHLGTRHGDDLAGIGLIASPGRIRLGKQFALARMLPGARRLVPGLRLVDRIPFRLDWIGQATALAVQYAGEQAAHFPISPWVPGSMEKELLVGRLARGFDVTGMGVVAELAEWGEMEQMPVRGTTADLLADFKKLGCPIFLMHSDSDEIVPGSLAIRPSAFPSAEVVRHQIDGFGHCDIVLGVRAPQEVWPHVTRWLSSLA